MYAIYIAVNGKAFDLVNKYSFLDENCVQVARPNFYFGFLCYEADAMKL